MEDLPDELLADILLNLTRKDLYKYCTLNKRFNNLCKDEKIKSLRFNNEIKKFNDIFSEDFFSIIVGFFEDRLLSAGMSEKKVDELTLSNDFKNKVVNSTYSFLSNSEYTKIFISPSTVDVDLMQFLQALITFIVVDIKYDIILTSYTEDYLFENDLLEGGYIDDVSDLIEEIILIL